MKKFLVFGSLGLLTYLIFKNNGPARAQGGGLTYIPKFHRNDQIIAPSMLPEDIVYIITDLYYNQGEWMYSIGQVWDGNIVNDTMGYRARDIDPNYVLVTGVI